MFLRKHLSFAEIEVNYGYLNVPPLNYYFLSCQTGSEWYSQVLELDPVVVDLARDYFDFRDDERLTVIYILHSAFFLLPFLLLP